MQWNIGKNLLIWNRNWCYYLELFTNWDSLKYVFYTWSVAAAIFDILQWYRIKSDLPLWEMEIRDFVWESLKINNDGVLITFQWKNHNWKIMIATYNISQLDDRVKNSLSTLLLCEHKSGFCLLSTRPKIA